MDYTFSLIGKRAWLWVALITLLVLLVAMAALEVSGAFAHPMVGPPFNVPDPFGPVDNPLDFLIRAV